METNKNIRWYQRAMLVLTVTTIVPTSLLLMSQTEPMNQAPAGDNTPQIINSTDASRYINNYDNTAEKTRAVVKGMIIENSQLQALNSVAAAHASSTSYRLYFATNDSGISLSIAVAMDANGNDLTDNMYSAARTGSNLCPPMCDAMGGAGAETR